MTASQTIQVIGAVVTGGSIARVWALAGVSAVAMARGSRPIGPLALAERIGRGVALAVMAELQRGCTDPKHRPAPPRKEIVAAGPLGRKSGSGAHTNGGKR
jgi:3-hydroxyacyl-CoA dehydrogenase